MKALLLSRQNRVPKRANLLVAVLILTFSFTGCLGQKSSNSNSGTSYEEGPTVGVNPPDPSAVGVEVTPAAPSLSYPSQRFTLHLFESVAGILPTNTGGSIALCQVAPALPKGLVFNPKTCEISGKPTELNNGPVEYVISASNLGGSSNIPLEITVANVVPAISYVQPEMVSQLYSPFTSGAVQNSGGDILHCTVSPDLPAGLVLHDSTCIISGTPTHPSGQQNYSIVASNAVGQGQPVIIALTVSTIAPDIKYDTQDFAFPILTRASTGAAINSGGAITTCTVTPALPAGLSVDQQTCEISGTPNVVKAIGSYQVVASNSVGSSRERVITIATTQIPPHLTFLNHAYVFQLSTDGASDIPGNSGGLITNCAISPTLPSGLNLDPKTCQISGRPLAVAGSASYTITAANEAGSDLSPSVLSVRVDTIPPQVKFSLAAYAFSLKSAADTLVPSVTGGIVEHCSIAPALPSGLAIDDSTCRIHGIPSQVLPETVFQITPSNASGAGKVETLSIRVNNIAPSIAFSVSSHSFNVRERGSSGVPVNSGGTITNCSAGPQALPAGIAIDPLTCEISGTPVVAQKATQYAVTAVNEVGSSSVYFTLTVADWVPKIVYAANVFGFDRFSKATTGIPQNLQGNITSCSVTPRLPAGLVLAATTCEISGTPTVVTSATNYTVTPRNAIGLGAPVVLSIQTKEVPPRLVYTASSYTFNYGVAGATDVPVNKGGTITNCTVSPALPTGLVIGKTNCRISGSSKISGSGTYQIVASNVAGTAPGVSLSITVTLPATPQIGVFNPNSYAFKTGVNIATATPANLNGAPITGCLVSPTLPAGLSAVPAHNCVVTGKPTVAVVKQTYTVRPTNQGGIGNQQSVFICVYPATGVNTCK